MDIKQQATEQVIEQTTGIVGSKVAAAMTYGGGAVTFFGGLTLNEFAIVFGMAIGALGFFLQVYQTLHKRRLYLAESKLIQERAEREREEHSIKMGKYQ